MGFENSVVVITGGASGIGEETARRFTARGARVVIADTDKVRGEALAAELGENAVFHLTDVSKSAQVQALFGMVEERFGVLDVLFDNAARSSGGSLWETSEEEWDQTMSVCLKGYFLCAKYALPLLKKSGHGAIICTGSEQGIVGCVGSIAYNTAKGGIIQFAKSLAIELAPFNIRVNVVCPSGTVTPGLIQSLSHEGNYEKEAARLIATYPLRRLGEAADIANAVLFLASEEASFITGTHLMVDGGFTAQ